MFGSKRRALEAQEARLTEATPQQLVATGAVGGFGTDPIDGDTGFRKLGESNRAVPEWTRQKTVAFSVAAYRSNPMARAIVDTYTAFCVGDSGLTLQVSDPQVRKVANEFWTDPRNMLGEQTLALRTHMLMGETVNEMMVGPTTGVARRSVVNPDQIESVGLLDGNPLWPNQLNLRNGDGSQIAKSIIAVDEFTKTRMGEVFFWASWKALEFDTRGDPFLGPVVDWLDSYDTVLSNLIDRTALARYLALDVTVNEGQNNPTGVDDYIKKRGSTQVPRSGSMEVHNEAVTIKPVEVSSGSYEDTTTAAAILTNIAGGTGLAKTWLAEPEDANRATSLTMAEPVRRRIGGIQNLWLSYQTEMVRFAVDQAVVARRLPEIVLVPDQTGGKIAMRAADTVSVTGPTVASADADINADVLVKLASSLSGFKLAGLLSDEACAIAVQKGWEQFVGIPFPAELAHKAIGDTSAAADDIASHIDDNTPTASPLDSAKVSVSVSDRI